MEFMHRFYLPPESCDGRTFRLEGREAHHALQVLRLQTGETVAVLDGVGHEFQCEVEYPTRRAVSLVVRGQHFVPPPPCRITLIQALPKGKIMDAILQKAVELGAQRVIPILSERVVTQLDEEGAEGRREKWRQVTVEAIKQSGAAWLPAVDTPASVAQFLARRVPFELVLVGSLQPERRHPRQCLEEYQARHGRPAKRRGLGRPGG